MRIESKITDGKVTIPEVLINGYKMTTGVDPNTVIFDINDSRILGPTRMSLTKKVSGGVTEFDLIDLSMILDKLDATGASVYALQFNDRLQEISERTGLPIPDIKSRVRQHRKQ